MRYQPQGLARVARSNPLCAGLVSLASPGSQRDVVRNVAATLSANAALVASSKGLAWRGASSNCAVDIGISGGLDTLIPNSQAVSWFGLIYVSALGVRQILLGDFNSSGNGASIDVEVTAGNQYRFSIANSNSQAVEVTGGTATLGWHTVQLEITAGNFNVTAWIDGVSIGSSSSVAPRRNGTALRLMAPGLYPDVAFQGQLVLSAFWNRALAVAERDTMFADPWQVFEAPDDWEDVAADAGITVSNGSASGSCSVTAVTSAIWGVYGASTGQSGTSTAAMAISSASGSSAGVSVISSVVRAIWQSDGVCTASSSVSATTQQIWVVVANSSGSSTANAMTGSSSYISADGSSSGSSFVDAVARSIVSSVGSATGVASVGALTNIVTQSQGTSTGTSAVSAVTLQINSTSGSALGTSSVNAVTQAVKAAVGNAVGSSTVNAITSGGIIYIQAGDRLSATIITEEYVTQLIDKISITLY